jgi:hypothetical protein
MTRSSELRNTLIYPLRTLHPTFVQMLWYTVKVIDRHVKYVTCYDDMVRLCAADGGDILQKWRVAVNMLNKQTGETNKR